MPAVIQPRSDGKATDIVVINPNVKAKVVFFHANSSKEKIEHILAQAAENVIFAGDWNDDIFKKLTSLEKYLDRLGLKIEMSQEQIDRIQYLYKKRSATTLRSQQLLKNNVVAGGVKDLAFKLVKKKEGELSVPPALTKKLNKIEDDSKRFKRELSALIKKASKNADPTKKTVSDAVIDALCKKYNIINYHNLENGARDHQSCYHYDAKTNTIAYGINSIQYKAYSIENHFKANEDGNYPTPAELQPLYDAYDKLVLSEFYKLILKRDGKTLTESKLEKLSVQELRDLINEALDDTEGKSGNPTNAPKEGGEGEELTREDYLRYYTAIFKSEEFNAINEKLLDSYSPEEIDARLSDTDSGKDEDAKKLWLFSDHKYSKEQLTANTKLKQGAMTQYSEKLERLINVAYQALAIDRVPGQAVGMNGSGFDPYLKPEGTPYTEEEIEHIQIAQIKRELRELHDKHPRAALTVGMIEGITDLTKRTKQAVKVRAIEEEVNRINKEVRENRESHANFYFYLNAALSVAAASATVAGAAIAGLALASILTIATAGVAGILVASVAAGLAAYSVFVNRNNYRYDAANDLATAPVELTEVPVPAGP